MRTDETLREPTMLQRRTIAVQHAERLSKDELENQKLEYESQGWTDVQVRSPYGILSGGQGWKSYEWSGKKARVEWVHDFTLDTYDVDADDLAKRLLEDERVPSAVRVLDWTDPVDQGEDYIIHSIEVEAL